MLVLFVLLATLVVLGGIAAGVVVLVMSLRRK